MKTVIYVNGTEKTQDLRKYAGIKAFAAEAGWNAQAVHALRSRAEIDEVVSFWNPVGFIVNCGAGLNVMPISHFGKVPAVFFDVPRGAARPRGCCIFNDSAATARLAAKELLALDLPNYAYVGWTKRIDWSTRRQDVFSAALAVHGIAPSVLDLARPRVSETECIATLARWLKGLDKPVGVFAANDHIASLVASACAAVGLDVPSDIAIVGVDDDENICEGKRPTLSSVALDYFAAGRIAAEALRRLMSDGNVPDEPILYPPRGIVRRESTRRFPRHDKIVEAAVERIRCEACSGLSAKDVIRSFPCSRRSAEMRFRTAVGHSILDEIRRVRLETAKALLLSDLTDINAVAHRCGYRSLAAFSIFFRTETGTSPSIWRRQSK